MEHRKQKEEEEEWGEGAGEQTEAVKPGEEMWSQGESWSTFFCLDQVHLSETRCTYLRPGRHKPLQLLVLVAALKWTGFISPRLAL